MTPNPRRPDRPTASALRGLRLGCKSFCDTVCLAPDVIAAFPNAEAVIEALRYLIELAKRTNSLTQRSSGLL
jgi:hypothetical protein